MLPADLPLRRKMFCDRLTQKEHRPGVHQDASVKALWRDLQQITTPHHANPCVVHQA
jgi:hypothetical protein